MLIVSKKYYVKVNSVYTYLYVIKETLKRLNYDNNNYYYEPPVTRTKMLNQNEKTIEVILFSN